MLFATDRCCIQCSRHLVCWSQLQSLVLPGRQRENTPGQTCGQVRTGADATMRHSHISGGRAFSHCHDDVRWCAVDCIQLSVCWVRRISWNFACGRLAGRLIFVINCRTLWEVIVKGREQHNRTWLIVHWAVTPLAAIAAGRLIRRSTRYFGILSLQRWPTGIGPIPMPSTGIGLNLDETPASFSCCKLHSFECKRFHFYLARWSVTVRCIVVSLYRVSK